jgi:hypothetical protein
MICAFAVWGYRRHASHFFTVLRSTTIEERKVQPRLAEPQDQHLRKGARFLSQTSIYFLHLPWHTSPPQPANRTKLRLHSC